PLPARLDPPFEPQPCDEVATSYVLAWGKNDYAQLGGGGVRDDDPHPRASEVDNVCTAKQLAVGKDYTLALLDDGTVVSWGRNDHGQLGNGTKKAATFPVFV